MNLAKIYVVIADDNVLKAREIRTTLERNGIRDIDVVKDQEKLWEMIYGNGDGAKVPDLIVTDMQYPLAAGTGVDAEAGSKLLERMEKEHINIPVIICSEANYENPSGASRGILLGGVLYREDKDCYFDFKELLSRL